MSEPILLGCGRKPVVLLPGMANRHGLIAGATGTGKTVTLQVLAEGFSRRGVPVFLADIKGDLSGISQPGRPGPKIQERIERLGLRNFVFGGCPVRFWDVFGEAGHPVRSTVSEMGPLLLSRLLGLNEVQSGVLTAVFRIADENGLLLLDLKDLRAMLQFAAENSARFTASHGHISSASVGAIQRGLLTLEDQGGKGFFGEPALDLAHLLAVEPDGAGVVNVLAADRLMQSPRVYATFLLWMLSELFERLPEAGDLEQPKLVFFFDEAHLLFDDLPRPIGEKIEQVVRLIRSKGVGVYFVTQNPLDLPAAVLGQLGNRIQHALRAFTPADQKTVRAAADTFRPNPEFEAAEVITQLAVGEALISMLDETGTPTVVERAWICPPGSQMGPIAPAQRQFLIQGSPWFGTYEQGVDRESAFERLQKRAEAGLAVSAPAGTAAGGLLDGVLGGGSSSRGGGGRRSDDLVTVFAKSMTRTVANQVGRQIMRGLLGSIFGGRGR